MWLANILSRRRNRATFEENTVVLIIADISGYTQFMLSTRTSLLHGQMIINELLQAIIEQVKIPLKIAKLEGDAVLLYALFDSSRPAWKSAKQRIADKLLVFFDVFSAKLHALEKALQCTCDACSNVHELGLKVIVHTGTAVFYQIGDFMELAGVDVIILHRLLKNSVELREYILMTEAAYSDIPISAPVEMLPHEETYPAIGTLKAYLLPVQHPLSHHAGPD